jgi:alkylation response protein AidB-like acyl-CoA dehydrogenase
MYFGLSDDALALRDGLREVLSSACSPGVIRAAWDGDPCEPLWKTLGEFGLLGMLVPEQKGGLGLDALSYVAATEEAGWHGVPGPLAETIAFLPVTELPHDGSVTLTVPRPVQRLVPARATHVLRGTTAVPNEGWFGLATVDRTRTLMKAESVDLPAENVALATLGTAAFLLGLARRQLDLTVAYVKDRKQFGVPVGSFQAVKHPIANAVVGTEFAWPAVLRAAYSLVTIDPDAALHVSIAKALASEAAYTMSRVCLQAHGAMGYTVEYDLHLFAKRTWALANDWGTAREHRATVARSILERTPS